MIAAESYAPDRTRVWEIALAGLLHDVGKLWRRAEPDAAADAPADLERLCQPVSGRGAFAHRHALATEAFFREHAHLLPPLRETGVDGAASLAACHHRPRTALQHLLAEADALSAGVAGRGRDFDDTRADATRSLRLHAAAAWVEITGERAAPPAPARFEPAAVTLDAEDLAPAPPAPGDADAVRTAAQYAYLRDGLLAAFAQLPRTSIEAWLAAALPAWERFTAHVPASAAVPHPTESLAEHGRATAALAAALYAELTCRPGRSGEPLAEARVLDRAAARFALCGVRLAGAREHVTGRDDAGGAGAMQARAAQDALRVDAAARRIVDAVDLPPCNVLDQTTDTAILLLPAAALTRASAVAASLDEAPRGPDGPTPPIAFAAVPLNPQDLLDGACARRWRDLQGVLLEAEHRPFAARLLDDPARFFAPIAPSPPPPPPPPPAPVQPARWLARIGGAAVVLADPPDETVPLWWLGGGEPPEDAGAAARACGVLPWPWSYDLHASGSRAAVHLALDHDEKLPAGRVAARFGLGETLTLARQLARFLGAAPATCELGETVWWDGAGLAFITSTARLAGAMDRFHAALARFAAGNAGFTASAGVALVDAGAPHGAAVARAEAALRQAREDGGDRVHLADLDRGLTWDALRRCGEIAHEIAAWIAPGDDAPGVDAALLTILVRIAFARDAAAAAAATTSPDASADRTARIRPLIARAAACAHASARLAPRVDGLCRALRGDDAGPGDTSTDSFQPLDFIEVIALLARAELSRRRGRSTRGGARRRNTTEVAP